MDRNDNPCIAYTDVPNRLVKYAERRNSKWQTGIVDALVNVSYPDRNGLALDDDGNPYISYFDQGAGLLKVAHRENDRWISEIVDQNDAGFTSAIQIHDGTIWLTYADPRGARVKFARRALARPGAMNGSGGAQSVVQSLKGISARPDASSDLASHGSK
jgi:hypothetical protein